MPGSPILPYLLHAHSYIMHSLRMCSEHLTWNLKLITPREWCIDLCESLSPHPVPGWQLSFPRCSELTPAATQWPQRCQGKWYNCAAAILTTVIHLPMHRNRLNALQAQPQQHVDLSYPKYLANCSTFLHAFCQALPRKWLKDAHIWNRWPGFSKIIMKAENES